MLPGGVTKLLENTRRIAPTSGTYAHANGTTEDTALTLTITVQTKIDNIRLDFTNLTKNTTVRTKVGGITADTLNWNTSMDDLQILRLVDVDQTVVVTIQSAIAEGAIRNINYRVL